MSLARKLAVIAAVLVAAGSAQAQPAPYWTSGKVIKWDQQPALVTPTSIYYGWNEGSVAGLQVAADDWVCTTTNPVIKIRWWGSFSNWMSSDATPVLPFDFRILFWTDQPQGSGNTFSHPQQAIWQIFATNFTWSCVGKDYDPRTGTFETCFLFEADLNPQDWFYQNPAKGTNIYWLSIAAEYPTGLPANMFGWKTRPRDPASPAPDAAVDILNPNFPVVGSVFGTGNPITWPTPTNQWDLAFELITAGPGVGAPKWEQLPDLSTNGMDVSDSAGLYSPNTPWSQLADDFLCTTPGYITNIIIWGSWTNDALPMNAQGVRDATSVGFNVVIYDDIPAAQSPNGYSMPGQVLWSGTFGSDQYIHSVYASNIMEGWQSGYNGGCVLPPADTVCHQYDLRLNLQDSPFYQQGTASNPKVYWLSVQAWPTNYDQNWPTVQFGWKSSVTNWNDAGVQYNGATWNPVAYGGCPRLGGNVDFAFRINPGYIPNDLIKWSQPPVVAANPGNWYNGWNEPSIEGGGLWNGTALTNIVADDWLCTSSRPVTDFHWWGSFLTWSQANLPPQLPTAFHFTIWDDVPVSPNNPFSHPGDVQWDYYASITDSNLQVNWVGWDFDPRSPCLDLESCFKFDYSLPSWGWFLQAPGTNIYWLGISAVYTGGDLGSYPFGWKTRPHVALDDAVRIFDPLSPIVGDLYMTGQPIEYPSGTSWDMAFQLTSCQQFQPVFTNTVFTNVSIVKIPTQNIFSFKWNNSLPGVFYQVQEVLRLTNNLPNIPWKDVGSPILGPINVATFTNSAADWQHYYRLRIPDICP